MVDYSCDPVPMSEAYSNLLLPNNLKASGVRLIFSNRFGTKPVMISQVYVNGERVTFGGAPAVLISSGGQETSGVTKVKLHPGEPVAVSYKVSEDFFTTGFRRDNPRQIGVAYLSGVEAQVTEPIASVLCIGDSLTAQCRWFSPLQRKLYETRRGKIVLNQCGVQGNRMLYDTPSFANLRQHFGNALLRRFVPDAIASEKPDLIILNGGTNDLIFSDQYQLPFQRANERLIQGAYHALIDEAHTAGSAIALSTIPPFGRWLCWNQDMERRRTQINHWIRTQAEADYILDFDAVLRHQANPTLINPRYDCGDGAHPNDEGGNALARFIGRQIDFSTLWK